MKILLNGAEFKCAERATIQELLLQLNFSPAAIVVERNKSIVPRSEYSKTVLSEGDSLLLIQVVGGG